FEMIVMKATVRERLSDGTHIHQTSDGTVYYEKYTHPRRLYVKWKGKLLDVKLPSNEITDVNVNGVSLFFSANSQIHKVNFYSTLSSVKVSIMRKVSANDTLVRGIFTRTLEGWKHVYRICDDPNNDLICVNVLERDLEGTQLLGIHRGNVLCASIKDAGSNPSVSKLSECVHLIEVPRPTHLLTYSHDSSKFFYIAKEQSILVLNTETMTFLQEVSLENAECIRSFAICDGTLTFQDVVEGVECMITAELPTGYADISRIMVEGPVLKEDKCEENEEHYYYDVKKRWFIKWQEGAVCYQNKYTINNGDTDYFVYPPQYRNRLLEYIRIKIFGIRTEDGYKREETEAAVRIKKKVVEISGGNEEILINVVFLSTFAFSGLKDEEDQLTATEIPVFVVSIGENCRKFVDTTCSVFDSVANVVEVIGRRFKGGILYPVDLSHKPTDGKVLLLYTESTGSNLQNRALDTLDTTLTIASIVTGIASVAVSGPLGAYLGSARYIGSALRGAAFASSLIAFAKTSIDLSRSYASGEMEDAGSKVIFLFAMALSASSQKLMLMARTQLSTTMQVKDVEALFGGWFKSIFYTLRISATLPAFVSITQSIYALYKSKKWTIDDCYRLSMSLFSLYNILMSPWTIEAILQSEQMRSMEKIEIKMGDIPDILIQIPTYIKQIPQYRDKILKHGTNILTANRVLRKFIRLTDDLNFVQRTSGILQSRDLNYAYELITKPGPSSSIPGVDSRKCSFPEERTSFKSNNFDTIVNGQKDCPENYNEMKRILSEIFMVDEICLIKIANKYIFANEDVNAHAMMAHFLKNVDASIIHASRQICDHRIICDLVNSSLDFSYVVEILSKDVSTSPTQLVNAVEEMNSLSTSGHWPSPLFLVCFYEMYEEYFQNETDERISPDDFFTVLNSKCFTDEFNAEMSLLTERGIPRHLYY
ncbi:hypothetical protein PMAYCL1PPCAC_08915, partial [Pristionchus mayeri]